MSQPSTQAEANAKAKPELGMLVALPAPDPRDRRTPVTPESAAKLIEQGWAVHIPAGTGLPAGLTDDMYLAAGANITTDPSSIVANADAILCVSTPGDDTLKSLKQGAILAGFLDPFGSPAQIKTIADLGLRAIALELVPRTTIAQPMDALSSQASLAGYAAAVLAASRLTKALPMMSTPAGTIKPARVLVVGTGVAGLQAIATAVRLGARVTAYDVRPTAKEQVESLGAKFAKIELGETGEAAGGYAKQLTDEQLELQRQQLARLCAESDVIITTAQIFGRRAPIIVTNDMIRGMKPGSVLVDAAIATGGNIEASVAGEETDVNGVTLIADPFLPSRVAQDASAMLASNFVSLLKHAFDPATGPLKDPASDEIVGATLLTADGQIRDERVLSLLTGNNT